MPPMSSTHKDGKKLQDAVVEVCGYLDLKTTTGVKLGMKVDHSDRYVDVVVTDEFASLAIECKSQMVPGSAQEKVTATMFDLILIPMPAILVYAGHGFTTKYKDFLYNQANAFHIEDLQRYLEMFFDCDLSPEYRQFDSKFRR